jgi:hypothetical protein
MKQMEEYTGSTVEPDVDGYFISKGGCITFDQYADDPKKIFAFARKCRIIAK